MELDLIALLARLAHLMSALTAAGGTIFMWLAAAPACASLPKDARDAFHESVRRHWAIPLHTAIAFLLLSGLYNYISTVRANTVPQVYHMLFGVKFLLGLVVFFVAISLMGRSALAQRMRPKARSWLGLNVALIVVIVTAAAVMNQAERTPKAVVEATPAESTMP